MAFGLGLGGPVVCGVWCVVWGWAWFGLGLSVGFVCGGDGCWVWLMSGGWMGSMGDGHVGLCGVSDVVCVGGWGWGGGFGSGVWVLGWCGGVVVCVGVGGGYVMGIGCVCVWQWVD